LSSSINVPSDLSPSPSDSSHSSSVKSPSPFSMGSALSLVSSHESLL
jgi:hypothetical protein